MSGIMAGYNGFRMSNNAAAAYEHGERPLSKWTKADIISSIESAVRKKELILACDLEKLKNVQVKVLKTLCLSYSSWHHTGNRYNKTDFYLLDIGKIAELTDAELDREMKESKAETKTNLLEERWKCAFLEWHGTKKHPKAIERIESGVIKGDWFYRADGSRKKTTANGFRFIEKIQ